MGVHLNPFTSQLDIVDSPSGDFSDLTLSAGTAAAPSISFTGDPNTGLYSPGANQVAISTNGTGRLFIDSSGNVGIGTTSPSELLHVNGNALVEDRLLLQRLQSSDNLSVLTFSDTLSGSKGNNLSLGNPGGYDLLFHAGGVESARITSAGLVGIGTSSPISRLTCASVANAWAGSFGAEVSQNQYTGISLGYGPSSQYHKGAIAFIRTDATNGAGDLAFCLGSTSNATNVAIGDEKVRITSTGRVGIGSTSPNYVLDVSTTGSTISSSFTSDQSEQYIALKDSGTTLGHVRLGSTSGSMLFFAGNGERGRFDSSGRLLVGTSSDSGGALLQVNGDRIRVATAKTPASASDTGTTGEICWDASYIYVCTATNTWKRAALSTW